MADLTSSHIAGSPLKIDVHAHMLPQQWPDLTSRFGPGDWIRLELDADGSARMMRGDEFFRRVQPNCFDPRKRIEDLDRCNVDVQVISTVPVMFNYDKEPSAALGVSQWLNDDLADVCRRHPSRFVGLGTIPMQMPRFAVRELDRCMTQLGLAGVQIGSHIPGPTEHWNLDADELFPVFEAAESLGAAVFVHPWDMCGAETMRKYWLPWLVGMPAESARAACSLIFGGVLERLPRLRVMLAHGGGSFPFTIGRIEHGFNTRPDLCAIRNNVNPREYLARLYVDSATHDETALRHLIEIIGAPRIALGSDAPFPLGEHHPGLMIENMDLPDETRQRLLSGTALEFLNLDPQQYLAWKHRAATAAQPAE